MFIKVKGLLVILKVNHFLKEITVTERKENNLNQKKKVQIGNITLKELIKI